MYFISKESEVISMPCGSKKDGKGKDKEKGKKK